MGKWVLAAGILKSWLIKLATEVSVMVINVLFAFLAGAVILNVVKEELPDERKSRFLVFLTGVTVYALLQLLL